MPYPSEPPPGRPVLDVAARALADRVTAGPDPRRLPLSQIRARRDLTQLAPAPRPDTHIEDLCLPAPHGVLRVLLVRPATPGPALLPVILYLHGGGWIAGSVVSHDRLVREPAAGVGAAVVLVDYDLAPDAPCPTALRQAHAAARRVVDSADYLRRLWRQYVPEPARRTEPTAAPLNTAPHQRAGLAPALVITAEADVLRDEAEAYAAKLPTAGVPVTCVRYQGTIHAFVVLEALRETGAARAALGQILSTLREALHPPQETA